MRLFRRRAPIPPENVRIITGDGDVIPVELVYRGRRRGVDHWEAVIDYAVPPQFHLAADLIPARTSIGISGTFRLDEPEPDD